MLNQLHLDVQKEKNLQKAVILSRFFKTKKGEYGEGDQFAGLTVPQCRAIAKKYKKISLSELSLLIQSNIHEERHIALLIAIDQFQSSSINTKENIFTWYIKHIERINNWDLVDISAPVIVGGYLKDKDTSMLIKFAHSSSIWKRRIAMLSTFHFIKDGDHVDALKIADILLYDKHDLIQKAVGWMLREIGKKCDQKILEQYLDANAGKMPRTAIRYAIEKIPEYKKRIYMNKKYTLISS